METNCTCGPVQHMLGEGNHDNRCPVFNVSRPLEYMAALPADEGKWLLQQVARFWEAADEQYDCVDSNRIADSGNDVEVRFYQGIHNEGCCGFVDVKFTGSPLGRTYLYGFNHGH